MQACEAVIRRHSRSFSLASRLLPSQTRRHAVALYAWCRHCDDAVDDAPNLAIAAANLAQQRENLAAVYRGQAMDDAILAEFQRTVYECRIPRVYAEDLVDGMAFDLEDGRIETPAALLQYGYQVAGTVGLMMTHVLGVRDDAALEHAAHLGMAMQLTNICRDVREDAQRGRCYLPAVWLSGEDPTQDEIARPLMQRLLSAAERFYASGDAGLCYLSPQARWAVASARWVYSAIGRKLAREGYRVSRPRAVVSKSTKLLLVTQAAGQALAGPYFGSYSPPERVWEFSSQECLRFLDWDSVPSLASPTW